MARLFIDGFNTGDASVWDSGGMSSFPANRAGFGPYCAYRLASTHSVKRNIGTQTTLYGKMRFELAATTGVLYSLFSFWSGGAPIAYLGLQVSDYLPKFYTANVISGGSGTLRATSNTALVVGRVYLMEFFYQPLNSSSGRFTLKVDGVNWIDWTGISTYGTENLDTFQVGDGNSGTSWYFSDVVLDSAAWIGPSRVGYKQVSGAGNYAQFTPLSGANYTNVDELPFVSTDFNYVNSNDQIDSFVTGALQVGTAGYSVNAIKCYQVSVKHRKTGSPTPTHLKALVRSGTTDDAKGSFLAADAAAVGNAIWEGDPGNSNAAWATNATPEIGYESAA